MKPAVIIAISGLLGGPAAEAADLATVTVSAQPEHAVYAATGVIEAVRQGVLAAQVSGRIAEVLVRNGDAVKAGQPLLRIEAGDSADAVTASSATARGAAARLESARADFERAQRLRTADYISMAALQRAEAAWHSAEAEAQASAAQARAAQTRAAWHTVTAPYAGHVMDLWVSAGDLAAPGKPLLGLYDPAALRVIAQLPESLAERVDKGGIARLAVGAAAPLAVASWRAISAVDAASHSVEVRAELPAGSRFTPGQFVQLQVPLRDIGPEIRIPLSAVVRRSEVAGVYVVDDRGTPRLRQLRLGPVRDNSVSVLSGLRSGERVALDPVVAGRR